jgi:hypothetical protein
MTDQAELIEEYGKSEHGNFYPIDKVITPHPYMIGAGHVEHASDRFSGRLGEDAIKSFENGIGRCGWKDCNLRYEEHESVLLILCKKPYADDENKADPELHEWLLKIKDQAEANGIKGFGFKETHETSPDGD